MDTMQRNSTPIQVQVMLSDQLKKEREKRKGMNGRYEGRKNKGKECRKLGRKVRKSKEGKRKDRKKKKKKEAKRRT